MYTKENLTETNEPEGEISLSCIHDEYPDIAPEEMKKRIDKLTKI